MPRFSLIPELIGDGIAVAIVLFAVTISVAKLFAKKHHYKINPAQVGEWEGRRHCSSLL